MKKLNLVLTVLTGICCSVVIGQDTIECHIDTNCQDGNPQIRESDLTQAEDVCCSDLRIFSYRQEGGESCTLCPEGRTTIPPTTEATTLATTEPTTTMAEETTTTQTETPPTTTTAETEATETEQGEGEESTGGSKCSGGCIAGIVIGVIAVVAVVSGAVSGIAYCVYHQQQTQQLA